MCTVVPLGMRQVTEVLEKAGYVERKGRRLELTPRGMRRIGQSALRDIFDQLKKSRMGQHQLWRGGQGIDASDELKDYGSKSSGGVDLVRIPVRVLRINDTVLWSTPVELFSSSLMSCCTRSPVNSSSISTDALSVRSFSSIRSSMRANASNADFSEIADIVS